jgi:hypothetical protein
LHFPFEGKRAFAGRRRKETNKVGKKGKKEVKL